VFRQERQMESKMIIRLLMISILWIAYCLYNDNINSFVVEHGLIDKTNQIVYNIIGVEK